jgi:hypothetical protein
MLAVSAAAHPVCEPARTEITEWTPSANPLVRASLHSYESSMSIGESSLKTTQGGASYLKDQMKTGVNTVAEQTTKIAGSVNDNRKKMMDSMGM